MYALVLALRYLSRRRITFLGVTAVALGVFAFIVVVGVMEGFRQELRRRLRGALGDAVVIGGLQDAAFREQVLDLLRRDPRVKAVAPRLEGVGILRMRGRSTSPGPVAPGTEGSQATEAPASGGGGEVGPSGSSGLAPSPNREPFARAGLSESRGPQAPERSETPQGASRPKEAELPGPQAGSEMTAFKLVTVAGVVPEEEAGVTDFPRYLLDITVGELAAWDEGKKGGPWLLAGEELVARPKVAVGAEVRLLVPRGIGEYDSFPFRLAGTFRTGIHEYDSQFVYVPLASAQKMRKAAGAVSRLVLRLAEGVSPDAATEPLQRALAGLAARFERSSPPRSWLGEPPAGAGGPGDSVPLDTSTEAKRPGTPAAPLPRAPGGPESTGPESTGGEPLPGPPWVLTSDEMNYNLLAAVRLEARMASLVLLFYFLVAGVAVFAIMTMVVVEKTRDMGVIRAVGGSVRGVLGTFLLYGLATGAAGVCIGVVGGRLTLSHLDWLRHQISVWTGWEPFPKELYMLDTLPWTFEPRLVLSVVAVALVTVLLSSLYPAWRGARLQPVETLRYE